MRLSLKSHTSKGRCPQLCHAHCSLAAHNAWYSREEEIKKKNTNNPCLHVYKGYSLFTSKGEKAVKQ